MRLLVALLNLAWAVLLVAPSACAQPDAPPAGTVLTGVTNREGAAAFDRQVGHRSRLPGLGRHRLLREVPQLLRPGALCRRPALARAAVRVRRVGAVGPRRPALRAPAVRLGAQPPSGADARLQRGRDSGSPFRLRRYP